ncbi:MAG: hypothetical protein ACRBN8_45775 [Nannocystales bacterium]
MIKSTYSKQVRHHYLYLAQTEREKGVKPGLSTTPEKCTLDEAFQARGLNSDATYKELAPWSLVGARYLGHIVVSKGYEIEKLLQEALTQTLGVRPASGSSLTEFYPGAEAGASLAILERVVNAWLDAEE